MCYISPTAYVISNCPKTKVKVEIPSTMGIGLKRVVPCQDEIIVWWWDLRAPHSSIWNRRLDEFAVEQCIDSSIIAYNWPYEAML